MIGEKSQSVLEQASLLEVEDVHLEATDPATHGKHCTGEDLASLGLLGLPRNQAKGVPASTDVPRLELGLAHAALHIEPSGAELERHPIVTDRLLMCQPSNCHVSGNDRELGRMHPGVFPRRQRPVPRQLGRTRSLQVLGDLAVQRSPPAGLIPRYSASRIRSCANAPATTTPAAAGSSSRASTSASGIPVTPARMPICGEPTTLATWSRSKDSWRSRASRCSRTCCTPGGIAPVGVPRLTWSRATSELKNGLPPVRRCTSAM